MDNEPSRMQRELKQRLPFRNKAQEGVVAVRRTADVVIRTTGRVIEQYGITDQQYNVLRILRGAHPDSLPTLEIGDRMIEREPNITRLLDRLERKGLVRRQRSSQDRRFVHCWISDAGLQLLATMDDPVRAAYERLFGKLTLEEQNHLVAMLDRLREGEP